MNTHILAKTTQNHQPKILKQVAQLTWVLRKGNLVKPFVLAHISEKDNHAEIVHCFELYVFIYVVSVYYILL